MLLSEPDACSGSYSQLKKLVRNHQIWRAFQFNRR